MADKDNGRSESVSQGREPHFEPGDTVFDRSGTKYEFAEGLSGYRALVRKILTVDSWEGEEEYPADTPEIVSLSTIFAKAPTAVIDADVQAATARLTEVREALANAESDLSAKQRDVLARLEKLQSYDGLQRIEDWLDGKITHFVIRSGYSSNKVQVKTADETLQCEDRGRFNGEMKLLCLYGTSSRYSARPKPTVEWRLNQYYDGSGSWTGVYPASSEEEAVKIAHGMLKEIFDAYFADEKSQTYRLEEAISSAEVLGYPVTQDAQRALHMFRVENARKQTEEAEKKLTEARRKLDALIDGGAA